MRATKKAINAYLKRMQARQGMLDLFEEQTSKVGFTCDVCGYYYLNIDKHAMKIELDEEEQKEHGGEKEINTIMCTKCAEKIIQEVQEKAGKDVK